MTTVIEELFYIPDEQAEAIEFYYRKAIEEFDPPPANMPCDREYMCRIYINQLVDETIGQLIDSYRKYKAKQEGLPE